MSDQCKVCQQPATHKVLGRAGSFLNGNVIVTLCQTHTDEVIEIGRKANEALFALTGLPYVSAGPVPIKEDWNYGTRRYA